MFSFLDGSASFSAANKDTYKSLNELEFLPDPITYMELAALERLRNVRIKL